MSVCLTLSLSLSLSLPHTHTRARTHTLRPWSYLLCHRTHGADRDGLWQLRLTDPERHASNPSPTSSFQVETRTLIGRLREQSEPAPSNARTGNPEYSSKPLVHHYVNGETCPVHKDDAEQAETSLSATVTYVCCGDASAQLTYTHKYTDKWPDCQNIVPKGQSEQCFNGQVNPNPNSKP